jgi:hypothetical protein
MSRDLLTAMCRATNRGRPPGGAAPCLLQAAMNESMLLQAVHVDHPKRTVVLREITRFVIYVQNALRVGAPAERTQGPLRRHGDRIENSEARMRVASGP